MSHLSDSSICAPLRLIIAALLCVVPSCSSDPLPPGPSPVDAGSAIDSADVGSEVHVAAEQSRGW